MSRENKKERRELIRERAREAIRDLYHNATPAFVDCQNEYEGHLFQIHFESYAESEIEYVQAGGAYPGKDSTCDFIRSQYQSKAAGAYAVRRFKRQAELDRAIYAPWEWVSERFGKLYQYGRGGRTLAPEKLVTRGAYWKLREDYFDDAPIADAVEGIRILESFNRFVKAWNADLPNWWKEEKAELELQAEIDAHEGKRQATRTVWI